MPKAFDDCVVGGGKVITKQVNEKEYMHICYPKNGGSAVPGEVKKYKKVLKTGKPKTEAKKIFGKSRTS